jgi:exopolysaccharide/PEP-CTERM locus tyrosine autokinase
MSRIDKAIEMAAKKNVVKASLFENNDAKRMVGDRPAPPVTRFPIRDPIAIDNPLLVPFADPNSPTAEYYKKLRAHILRKTRQNSFENSLLITSAIAGEGKSLTAMNLALSIASMADCSVVLVDVDLRNPQMHVMLGIKPEYGLVHFLRDGVPVERIIQNVGLGHLSIIPVGEPVADPLSLLTSPRMKGLVKELKHRYPDRYVLFDAPPTLPFADMRTLGELVDNIIFVCREGYSTLGQIRQGLETLSDYNLMGVVCNDMKISMRMDYSHYYDLK